MEESEILEKLERFADLHRDRHTMNIQDFKVSKHLASGRGFQLIDYGTIWNQDRARVCVNLMEPLVNSIVYKFTEDPFDFLPKNDMEAPKELIDFSELKFQMSACLRECVQDGVSYILAYKKDEKLRFKKLNNYNVIFGDSDYSDGADAMEAVYIDKKQTEKRHSSTGLRVAFDKVLNLTQYEIPVLTYYFKTDEGVTTCRFENDKLVESVTQPIKNIPIARIYAKEMPINNEKNWRGLYYLVKDQLRTIDLYSSLLQERVATAPNHGFWAAEESLGANTEQYAKMNDIPVACKTYKTFDPSNPGVKLDPPTPVNLAVPTEDLLSVIRDTERIVYQIMGNVSGTPSQSETAEAVLLKRENRESASNDILKNLLDSAYYIASIMEDFTGIGFDVAASVFDKIKKQQELEKIMAVMQIIQANQNAYAILPILLSKSDLEQETQRQILMLLQEKDGLMADANQKIQQLEQQQMAQQMAIEAQLTQAQIGQQTQMASLTLQAQTDGAKIELEWAKLGQKAGEANDKLLLDVQKLQSEFELKQIGANLSTAKFITEGK